MKPRNTTALEGYPVMIHCVAIGDPQPTIHWDKNNQVNGFDVKRFKVNSDDNELLDLSHNYSYDSAFDLDSDNIQLISLEIFL